MVVGELCMGDLISPRTGVGPTENSKVCVNLLVDMFSFSIGLRVISSGEGEVVVEKLVKFFGKGRGKLWTMIRDDFVVKSKM